MDRRLSVMLHVTLYRRLGRRLSSSSGGRRRRRGPLRGHSNIVSSNSNMPPRCSISPPSVIADKYFLRPLYHRLGSLFNSDPVHLPVTRPSKRNGRRTVENRLPFTLNG